MLTGLVSVAVDRPPARSLTTNVNGQAINSNATRTDGATNVNIWLPSHNMYVSPAETIDTVNVSTNNFDAEQGMAGDSGEMFAATKGAIMAFSRSLAQSLAPQVRVPQHTLDVLTCVAVAPVRTDGVARPGG